MSSEAIHAAICRAFIRGQTPREVAAVFDLPIADVEAMRDADIAAREVKAVETLSGGGSQAEAQAASGLPLEAVARIARRRSMSAGEAGQA